MTDIQQIQQDPIAALRANLAAHRARIKETMRRLPEDSPIRQPMQEIEATVLAFIDDGFVCLTQVREYLYSSIVDVEANLSDQIADLTEDDTQFTPEDAARFTLVCQGAQRMAELGISAPGQSAEAKAKMQEILAAAKECLVIIQESTLPDDEEDDGDGDEEEGE